MKKRNMLCAAATGVVMAAGIGVSPALAAYDVLLYTADDSAVLSLDRFGGSVWQVCDHAPDGMRAVGEVRNSSGTLLLRMQDANGSANDDCGEDYLYPSPASGTRLHLKVWVQNGTSGSPRYTRSTVYTW